MGLDGVVSKGSLMLADGCWALDLFRGNQPRLWERVDFGGEGVCQGYPVGFGRWLAGGWSFGMLVD